jgi:hypothetical protein
MVSPATGPTESSVRNSSNNSASHDWAVRMQQQTQLWDEEAQNISAEASVISQRLVTIRSQLVTISDKTSSAVGTAGSDVTEEEMQMAMEAQKIMKRLGEIRAQLSQKKKKYQTNTSRDSSSAGLASISETSSNGRSAHKEGSFPVWNRPSSVLPSAVSLGTTPCMLSTFSAPPGYLNVTAASSSSSSLSMQEPGPIPAVIPHSTEAGSGRQVKPRISGAEQRDGAPPSPSEQTATSVDYTPPTMTMMSHSPGNGGSRGPDLAGTRFLFHKSDTLHPPTAFDTSRSSGNTSGDSFSFLSDHVVPKVTPWGRGTPGRLDHGIGVIVKPLQSIPSLEPIVSLDNSSSSELSPIPTADDTSLNAFDYELTKSQPCKAGIATPSLLDDTALDISSIEDPLEAAERGVVGIQNKRRTAGAVPASCQGAPSFPSCKGGSIMDLFACGGHQDLSADPFLDAEHEKPQYKEDKTGWCIEKAACDQELGQDYYSVGAFLRSFQQGGAWT